MYSQVQAIEDLGLHLLEKIIVGGRKLVPEDLVQVSREVIEDFGAKSLDHGRKVLGKARLYLALYLGLTRLSSITVLPLSS